MPQTARLPGAFQDSEPGHRPDRSPERDVRRPAHERRPSRPRPGPGPPSTSRPDQRAMSLQIDAVNGVGTIIQTGDYVDMVLGFTGDAFPVVESTPRRLDPGRRRPQQHERQADHRGHAGPRRGPPDGRRDPAAERAGDAVADPPARRRRSPRRARQLVILVGRPPSRPKSSSSPSCRAPSPWSSAPQDFFDENGEPEVPIPAGTTGIALKTLVDAASASPTGARRGHPPRRGRAIAPSRRSQARPNPAARRARRTSGPAPVRRSGSTVT